MNRASGGAGAAGACENDGPATVQHGASAANSERRKRSRRRSSVRGFRAIVLPASVEEAWWIATPETVKKRRELLAELGIAPHAFAGTESKGRACRRCDRGEAFFAHDDDLRRRRAAAAETHAPRLAAIAALAEADAEVLRVAVDAALQPGAWEDLRARDPVRANAVATRFSDVNGKVRLEAAPLGRLLLILV
jgi:hypothetical protein